MPKYRQDLPQLEDRLFLSDSGMETTFIFHEGVDLPLFASFTLMESEQGRQRLRDYYQRHMAIAAEEGAGFLFDTPTWRASSDWGDKLGYSAERLADVNRSAVDLLVELRENFEQPGAPMIVSGVIGPRGDGYVAGELMSEAEAQRYHAAQIGTFAASEADVVGAYTLTNIPEAIGIARAAVAAGIPIYVSFTLETDGRLPTGQSLEEAILSVDAATGSAPIHYMINCAHPVHFTAALEGAGEWLKRVRGIRANSSRRSHAELNESPTLDEGNPAELGEEYAALLRAHPQFTILGGCCGTDHRHVAAIGRACRPLFRAVAA